jgi:ubiquinone/menaquinone biosynthesis C-methylase UbiE
MNPKIQRKFTMIESQRSFLPAAGHDLFLPLYDPFARLMGADRARSMLLGQAALRPHQRILEVGCGTGSLTVQIKRRFPDVEVVGLDPDRKALARAKRKAERAAVSIAFDQGFADAMGYQSESFDHVFSCLMFHHLEHDDKVKMLLEVRRVLKPGGRLELLDLEQRESGETSALSRFLHGHHRLVDNSEETILTLFNEAGLVGAKTVGRARLLFGRIACYQALAPTSARGRPFSV